MVPRGNQPLSRDPAAPFPEEGGAVGAPGRGASHSAILSLVTLLTLNNRV